MLVSPAEPAVLRKLGQVSLKRTEELGVDFSWSAKGKWWGVQRKEIGDLVASMRDGRLAKELAQMADGRLHQAVLLVEGPMDFGGGGEAQVLLNGGAWGKPVSRRQMLGLEWGVQSRGVWWARSKGMQDTVQYLQDLEAWTKKEKHGSLLTRPGVQSVWGTPDSKDYGVHLLMGLPGVGHELAERIWDKFGGVPWTWGYSNIREALMEVEGIGKVKADKILAALPVL